MKITEKPELGPFMTFEASKEKPVHGWFWYKEGYAPEIVQYCAKDSGAKEVIDPFCGVGTTLLACKEMGISSVGIDASPLAVFVSRAKTEDYEESDLQAAEEFIRKPLPPAPDTAWDFELFPARAAFPRRNYGEILQLRHAIEQEEGRVRNLLLLALLSVLPQASIVLKDGGVLKIMKDKKALPAREIFKRKVKRMARELRGRPAGHEPEVFLGDARGLDLEGECAGAVITSPPYLNNIDYSKIYGLELSLLAMSRAEAEQVRLRSIRSFIGRDMKVQEMPPEVGEIGSAIPIIGTYFRDMELALIEMHRVLKRGGAAYVIVSNSVIHETHVMVDEIFAEMGERIGFSGCEIAVGAERIADVRPQKVRTRESIVILRK
ncbi:MAG TPA: DNA methyltransferase [Candidatus Bilamarchaeum sp.]|nr:DNA methyltransferase [Candidatus Bilamarchaeum sp.]